MVLSQSESYESIVKICVESAKIDEIFLDPLEFPLIEYTKPLLGANLRSGARQRLGNQISKLRKTFQDRSNLWETGEVPSNLIKHLENVADALSTV